MYILTNWKHTAFYTGVTNDLQRRIEQHKTKGGGQFTRKYNLTKLVFVEVTERIEDAIAGEKQIKGGSRQDKIDLINKMNPEWNDLYDEYFAISE
ncbi:MAG: GIY-YIG nuclease family protein [Anaerolineales bacterium]